MRKTNLFYNNGKDSKFLTFSNYTESLTGNFLSTDTKIFPSRFLCLNIKNLCGQDGFIDESKKKDFINNYLIAYYENKLAILRDKCIYNNENPESYITPLAYLLNCISRYINENLSEESTDNEIEINYIGDITEQDFNGTYTDTICIIDFNNYYVPNSINGNNIVSDSFRKQINIINDDRTRLYGWDSSNLEAWFKDNDDDSIPRPKFDDNNFNYYYEDLNFGQIELKNGSSDKIEFNVIIPLYDVTDMNFYTNETILSNEQSLETIDLTNNGHSYTTNVPLGIWFSDKTIELSRDNKTGFTQSWSLVISSQFKPFPYAKMQVNNTKLYSNSNAFPTFAMVLAKQNEVIDKFIHLEKMIIEQNEKINELGARINPVSNIDNIRKDMIKYEYDITNKFNEFKQDVNDIINNLRWKGSE